MMKHSFKLIWNQKKKNFYIILELFILFIVLLFGSIYLIQKYELYKGGVGADVDDVFYLRIRDKDFKESDFKAPLTKLRNELEAIPEIQTVSYSHLAIPYIGSMNMNSMKYDSLRIGTVIREVDEYFCKVLKVNLLEGRWFEDDYLNAHPPVIIDMLVAEKLFGSAQGAINKIVDFNGNMQVVGVYDKFKRNEYERNFPSSFIPIDQKSRRYIDIIVRYESGRLVNPSKLGNMIYKYFDRKQFILSDASTIQAKKELILGETHIEIVMLCSFLIFLIINIILGMIGIFGYNVKRRKAELGIRRALGSSAQKLHLLLLFESWSLTLLALIPAVIIAIQIPLLELIPLEMVLFLKALFISIFLIFSLVSLCVYYPAYMATKVQAADALKDE